MSCGALLDEVTISQRAPALWLDEVTISQRNPALSLGEPTEVRWILSAVFGAPL